MFCMSSVLKKFSTEFALEAEFVIVFIDGMDFFSMINGLAANRALGSCILHLAGAVNNVVGVEVV